MATQATQRQEKVREQGQVPRSSELASVATTGGALLVFYFAGSAYITNALELTQSLLGMAYARDLVRVMKLVFPKMMLLILLWKGIC